MARLRKTFCERSDSFHFLRTNQDAPFEFEIVEAVTRMRGFSESHDAVHRERFFIAQANPIVFSPLYRRDTGDWFFLRSPT